MPKSQIEKLKGKAKVLGLDVDALLEELVNKVVASLPPPPPVPLDEITEKVAVRVETSVAVKLAEVLDTLKQTTDGSKPDITTIVQGVASLLQPQIVQASKQAAEAVFEANAKVLLKQINDQLQAHVQAQGTETPGDGATPVANIGGMSLGGLLQFAVGHAEEIAKLAEVFKPKASPDQKIAEALGSIFKWNKVLNQIKAGTGNEDEIAKSLANIAAKPQP